MRFDKIRKTLGILLAVCFLMSVTIAAVDAANNPISTGKTYPGDTHQKLQKMPPQKNNGKNYGNNHGKNYGNNHGKNYGNNHGKNYGNNHGKNYGNNHGKNYPTGGKPTKPIGGQPTHQTKH